MYKPGITHVVANVLSKPPNITKFISVPNQTTNASLFYTKLEWLKNVKEFLKTRQIEGTFSI
jgi:hypothetical protein